MNEKIQIAKKALAKMGLYSNEGNERCGFIHEPDLVVEVPNVAPDPVYGFMISPAAIIENTEGHNSWATWHTHPNQDANLSAEDYAYMKAWDDMVHFIIGNDGVRAYQFDQNVKVVVCIDE